MDTRNPFSARLCGITAALLATLGTTCAIASPPHHDTGGYRNPHVEAAHGSLLGFLRARLFSRERWARYDARRDGRIPAATPALLTPGTVSANASVTWIGHATVLVQHAGTNVLTDPILSERASPVSFAGPRRHSPPALTLAQLPRIDIVVISHNHYDHLDAPTLRALGNGPRYFVPLGLREWFEKHGIDAERITELDWWDVRVIELPTTAITITATPSQHFSGRGVNDRNRTLWAAWALQWPDFSVWFGGDTGYNPIQFKEIGARFGGFDLGIIPIGAYLPRDFMGPVHVDPAAAVQIHEDIRARRSMAIHWGAFELAAEHLLAPPLALREATAAAGLAADTFVSFAVGETRAYPARGVVTAGIAGGPQR
jgi:N-acyl-phosphatidylethanolamine-hydrolysing phospholipase D